MFNKRLVNLILVMVMLFTAVFFSTACAPKEFTVTFNGGADGVILVDGKEVQKVESSSQIKEPIYIRDGYNFVGWNRSISMIKSSTTVKAQWREYDFQVVFQGNDGKTENNEETVVLTVNSAYELKQKAPEFIKEGYELSWDTNLSIVTKSCTINAVWTPKTYNLTFLDKDGLEFANNKMQVSYNQKVGDITVVAPEISGQRFAFWADDNSLDALSIDKDIVWKEDADVSFYANYVDENAFVIKYDLDGGERGQRTYSYTADMDENARILLDAKRTGYNFEGWLINGSQTPKLSKDIAIKDFKVNGEYCDVTLKACWGNRPYNINFDTQGGNLTGEINKQVFYDHKVGVLPTVQKEGYVFVGWHYNGKLITADDPWVYPTDATLTAKYLAEYKVKFSLTTFIKSNDKEITCTFIKGGSFSQVTDLQELELTVIEGQSLYTAFGFTKMPFVEPIEQLQKDYEYGNYWKWIDDEGNEHIIEITTVFNLDIFANVKGGETITLVPHCREIWSPNA